MRCVNCQFENPEGMNFCGKCATPLTPSRCRQCGFDNPDGFAFCGKCGSALTAEQKARQSKRERKKPAGTTQRKAKGQDGRTSRGQRLASAEQAQASTVQTLDSRLQDTRQAVGERRQLTVMFCDLVGSTALSEQLNPEELHQMVRAYQHTCAEVITRYEGHIAQYLGDGLLVYFGFPAAHEDDASRAVRTSLEILDHLSQLDTTPPLHVRIGIHTGHVVVGEVGEGGRREQLALGETPNIAARVQGQAEPDAVVISAATQQLVAGLFETEDCGLHELKGISAPQSLYRVRTESAAQSRFEVAVQRGLTPLVGRETEVEFLSQRWMHAQAGRWPSRAGQWRAGHRQVPLGAGTQSPGDTDWGYPDRVSLLTLSSK